MHCFSSSLLLTCAETFVVWDVLVGVMRPQVIHSRQCHWLMNNVSLSSSTQASTRTDTQPRDYRLYSI